MCSIVTRPDTKEASGFLRILLSTYDSRFCHTHGPLEHLMYRYESVGLTSRTLAKIALVSRIHEFLKSQLKRTKQRAQGVLLIRISDLPPQKAVDLEIVGGHGKNLTGHFAVLKVP